MKCPRCNAPVTAAPDEAGLILCAGCGARLRSRSAPVVRIQGGSGPRPAVPPPPSGGDAADAGDVDSVLARLDAPPNPSATLPPGTPLKKIPRPDASGAGEPVEQGAPTLGAVSLETLLAEIQAVRRAQDEMLELLRVRTADGVGAAAAEVYTEAEDPFQALEASLASGAAPMRSRRRKTVLLIDDDAPARVATVAALERADIPVKTAVDGNGGLAAIAMEKPDVIVLELGMGGAIGGKDVVNMIKATMEWVDIPIVLYTNVAIANQKEARTIHGADDYVLKGAGPEALVARIVAQFRSRG
jgi:CheY-like chemotaxis protein